MIDTRRAFKIVGAMVVVVGVFGFAFDRQPIGNRVTEAVSLIGIGTMFYVAGMRATVPRWLAIPIVLFSVMGLAGTRWPTASVFVGPPLIVFGVVFFAAGRWLEDARRFRLAFAAISGTCIAAGIVLTVVLLRR